MDDKFELDLIHDEIDFLEEENITESEMKMQRRKTLYDVSEPLWKHVLYSSQAQISSIIPIYLTEWHAVCMWYTI